MKKLLVLLVLWPMPGWAQSLKKPDAQLQALIRQWCAERPDQGWPQQPELYLLHGNQAYLWYLSPEGEVFSLDTDRFRQELEPETDAQAALEAVRQASRQRPELRALLPEQF